MRTISQVVEEEIRRSPFLQEAMAEGIANNAKIARQIRERVEKRLYEKVSEASISMALHRMSKNFARKPFGLKFLKQVRDITVRSDLVEYIVPNSIDDAVLREASQHTSSKNAFMNFSRGLHQSLLIISREHDAEISRLLKRHKGIRRTEGLSAITMHLPESSLNVPGLYYPVLKALAFEGISFVEVMSVDTEFSILFVDSDVDRAFSVIKSLIS